MAVTRINNNQITDASTGNAYVGINASTKVQDYSITAGKIANSLVYGSDLTVSGNLTVNGQTTTIDTVSTVIEDPVIVLASNQTGSPSVDIGFIGERGTSDNIAFVWDESADEFVTAFTTDLVTNTTVTISSYANFHTNDANIGGNITINGTTTLVGNIAGALNVTGNVTGGNLLTPGVVTATGNVTGGNVTTAGRVTATGNVTGGNLVTTGITSTGSLTATTTIAATGNITGGNLTTTGITSTGSLTATTTIAATGNITGGNLSAGSGIISTTGNINGGNVNATTGLTSTTVTATGNITGGNVSAGSGIISTTGNINGANLNATSGVTASTVTATSNIAGGNLTTAGQVVASGNVNGGNLVTSGITSTGSLTASTTISATGNITGGNLSAGSGIISTTGNVNGGNVNATAGITAGTTVTATGNVSGGNLTTAGQVTATGNITGGNLSAGSGIISTTGNINGANVNATAGITAGTTVTATGNITGGNLSAGSGIISTTGNINGANLNATSGVTSSTVVATANITGGNLITTGATQTGTLTTTGNAIVGGNLIVAGNISYTNVDDLRVEDPVIILGTGPNGAPLTTNDGMDRGVYMEYYTTGLGNAFMGWDNSSGNMVIASSVSFASNNVVTVGAYGTLQAGNLYVQSAVSTGNVTGGNLITAGLVSAGTTITATGNVTGGNLTTSGITSTGSLTASTTIVATGNVSGGNLTTAGQVTATGNVTGGNVISSALVSGTTVTASGNVTGGNLTTTGITSTGSLTASTTIVATGNITGGNLSAGSGIISTTGNINGGNVNATTGVRAATGYFTGNVDVLGNLNASVGIVYANSGIFYGNSVTGNNAAFVGVPGFTQLGSNVVMQFAGNVNAYSQLNFQNVNNGNRASTDYIATADNGSDTTYYIDVGINSSTFNDPTNYPGFGPNDSYVHNHGGNLILNPETAGKAINFMVGGTANANVIGYINASGLSVTGTIAGTGNVSGGNLTTAGQVVATGNVTGGNLITAGLVSAGTTITATGNVAGGNITTAGQVTATGNVSGGNVIATALVTGANVTATANVTGANVVGTTSGKFGNIVISGDNITDTNGRVNFNTAGADIDFAVNADTVANVFYIDAGTGTASFGSETQTTNAIVAFNSTNSILAPVGNVAQRPAVGVTGMVRFNTTSNALEIFDNSQWTTVGVPSFTVIADDQFNGDGVTVAFTLSSSQTTNSCIVSINGVVQIPTIAYSVSGTTLTFTEAPLAGDIIDVREITTTTTVTSISNSSGNASVDVSDTTNDVSVTGDLVVAGSVSASSFIGLDASKISNGTSEMSVIASGGNIRANIAGSTVQTISATGVEIVGDLSVTGNATLSGNILGDRVQNGTTSIDIQTTNGNANITVAGTSNVAVFTTTGLAVAGTVSVSGTGNVSGANLVATTAMVTPSITHTGSNAVGNIGSASSYFNTVFAQATSALYADLAEKYVADAEYAPGTVVVFGGDKEVTVSSTDADRAVAGVVSTNPSYIMNGGLEAEYVATVALTGRVPCRVTGTVKKGDLMVSAGYGLARAEADPRVGTVIGKALENHEGNEGVIEVVVGRF